MSWLFRGLTYCRQVAQRLVTQSNTHLQTSASPLLESRVLTLTSPTRVMSSIGPPRKFDVESPYKNPGASRHGYEQKFFDGGQLPRGLAKPLTSVKPYRPKNRWNKKRALFGQNDYIDILGDTDLRPVDLIHAPRWLKGFNGNELQRLIRRLKFDGHKIRQLYPTHYHQMWKRVKFLDKKYNHYRGKRHT